MSFELLKETPKFFYVGEYFVAIQSNKEYLYRVLEMDALNYIITGRLNSGQSYTTQDTNLEPPDGVLYAFLIGVKGGIKFYINQPPANARLGISAYPGFITEQDSPIHDPDPRTITYTLKGYPVAYTITNPTNVQQFYIVKFQGLKYRILQVADLTSGQPVPLTSEIPQKVIQEMFERYLSGSLPVVTFSGVQK